MRRIRFQKEEMERLRNELHKRFKRLLGTADRQSDGGADGLSSDESDAEGRIDRPSAATTDDSDSNSNVRTAGAGTAAETSSSSAGAGGRAGVAGVHGASPKSSREEEGADDVDVPLGVAGRLLNSLTSPFVMQEADGSDDEFSLLGDESELDNDEQAEGEEDEEQDEDEEDQLAEDFD